MANYTSLWTSGFDKEFRQLSKFHSLQKRRLGLQMAGFRREHVRHVRRVRVEIREAGTLVGQLEDEKERRARHLIKTFSKVQRKRQATHDWRTAFRRRSNAASIRESNYGTDEDGEGEATFEVEIGRQGAPWGGARVKGRRRSSASSFTSTTSSKDSRRQSRQFLSPAMPPGSSLNRKNAGLSPLPSNRRASLVLPPLGPPGGGRQPTPRASFASTSPLTDKFPSLLKVWQTTVAHRRANLAEDGSNDNDDNDADADSSYGKDGKGSKRQSVSDSQLDSARGAGGDGKGGARSARVGRKVFWTQTFPFVYHSVGETVCPRYKLFRQYEEYKVYPGKPSKRGRFERQPQSTTADPADRGTTETRPTFKGVSQSLGAVQSLLSKVNSMNLT